MVLSSLGSLTRPIHSETLVIFSLNICASFTSWLALCIITTKLQQQSPTDSRPTTQFWPETEVATVQTPKEISRRLGNSEDHGFAKIYCIRVGQRMRCKAGRAGQSSAGPAQHSTARHSAACYSEAADPTANSGGRRSTCSKLVMEPSRMPKNSTPVIWDISITARSALVMGRMSPNPMVETVVSDQYAAARYTSGPGMERAYMQST